MTMSATNRHFTSETERYKSYQSLVGGASDGDDEKDDELVSNSRTPSSQSFRRANGMQFSNKMLQIVVVSLLVVASILFLSTKMTEYEKEIASENNLPSSRSSMRKIRKAQSLADEAQANMLNGMNNLGGFISGMKFSPQHGKDISDDRAVTKIDEKKNKADFHSEKTSATEGCEATIVILRHCEKWDIREHCAYDGYERSVFLATLFGDDDERWPAPSYIFALGPGGRSNKHKMNFREIETVGPLSEKVGVPVDYSYNAKHDGHMIDNLLKWIHHGAMCGKVALISWKHSSIGHLAHRLGCGPAQGCPMDYKGKTFDQVWQIKYVYREFSHSENKNLHLDKNPHWKVFGSVQTEGFDPLAFSKKVGDYPKNGLLGRPQPGWQAADIPERKSYYNTDDWFSSDKVPFLGIPHRDVQMDVLPLFL